MAHVLLAVSASVAIYKACDLASKLKQRGHVVRAVLTKRAAELVSPQLFEAVGGERAYTDEFGATREGSMDHIALARWAEIYVAAPATADLIARLAHGMGDDLPTTIALALEPGKPRLVAPAMNPTMLAAPATRRNLATLVGDGWTILGSGTGYMACGEEGSGRLLEPVQIAELVESALTKP
jgi:phosphopantothenoylcysteine decarboxylase / phosphopantothenate---cysteine ligase